MFAGRKQKRYQRSSKSAGHPSQTPGAHSQPDTNAQMPAGKLARAAVFSALPSMNQASKPQSHQASLSGRCTTHPAALAPKTQPKNATQKRNPKTQPSQATHLRNQALHVVSQLCDPKQPSRPNQHPQAKTNAPAKARAITPFISASIPASNSFCRTTFISRSQGSGCVFTQGENNHLAADF
jgi:hypothetical protein